MKLSCCSEETQRYKNFKNTALSVLGCYHVQVPAKRERKCEEEDKVPQQE
jgi:hypothetical protein